MQNFFKALETSGDLIWIYLPTANYGSPAQGQQPRPRTMDGARRLSALSAHLRVSPAASPLPKTHKKLYITAPKAVEWIEEPLPECPADGVLVKTTTTCMSVGTELRCYRGIPVDPVEIGGEGKFLHVSAAADPTLRPTRLPAPAPCSALSRPAATPEAAQPLIDEPAVALTHSPTLLPILLPAGVGAVWIPIRKRLLHRRHRRLSRTGSRRHLRCWCVYINE